MTVSMAGGEIGPGLYARVDLAKYQSSLKTCRNFIVCATGGVKNRPGTRMVAETKTEGDRVRLIPFVFNNDQSYVLEAGDRYLRFFQNGAPINALVTVTAEPFGTGDGATKTFQLKRSGGDCVTPHDVAVYVNGVLQDTSGKDNLLTHAPNDFSAAAWVKGTGVTVTPNNAAAPDSTTTADTLAWSA